MLTTSPKIRANRETLSASTSLLVKIFTVGLVLREFNVNRATQLIAIDDRYAWFFKRGRVFPFSEIRAVTYGYEDINPQFGARDAVDRFVVGLRLRNGDEIKVFSFIGEGSFRNPGPLPDWWYWDDLIFDYTGPQERESRIFVQLLSKIIGTTIEPSSLVAE